MIILIISKVLSYYKIYFIIVDSHDLLNAGTNIPADPIEIFCIPLFKKVAAEAALFELKCRLLADNSKINEYYSKDLTPLIKNIKDYYSLSNEDWFILKQCAILRNNLFHIKLHKVAGKLRSLNEKTSKYNIVMGNLENGSVNFVSDMSYDAGVYGWLLENSISGAFVKTEHYIKQGIQILNNLFEKCLRNG